MEEAGGEMSSIEALPEPAKLKKLMKAQAALSIILCEEDWLRYHSFEPAWSDHIAMAKIDNGAGDHLFILFAPQGTILKGFDHESELSPYANDEQAIAPGIYEAAPNNLLQLLDDEAIEREDVTFCIWRENSDAAWQKGNVEASEHVDGSAFLIGAIHQTAEDYVDFANGYFEQEIPVQQVSEIYEGKAITAETIRILNPERKVEEAMKELESLGMC